MDKDLQTTASAYTVSKVTELVSGIKAPQGSPRVIQPTEPLVDAGVSSLDMVNLMLAIEASFDLFIPPEMINPKTFRSIGSIAAMIDTVKQRSPSALAS